MDVEIHSTTTFKPSPNSPSNGHIPLTIFDKAAVDRHVHRIFAFRPPKPSNADMKQALAKALAYFPHLAGRFSVNEQGSLGIVLNNAGICLVDASVNMTLAERLPLEPSPDLSKLHPPTAGVEELLQIQLNRFSCGGLVIGATNHHRVVDGQSMSTFMLAWAKVVQGLSSIENLAIHFSADFLAKLKVHVAGGDDLGHRYSTFECLLTHLWKKITVARGLQEDELTQVRISVNGRLRMKPAIPMEYFGNLVLWAYPKLRVRGLLDGSHAFVARTIHDAVAKIDDAYFKSFIDFGELSRATGGGVEMTATVTGIGDCLCPDLEADIWLRFQFYDLDLGAGGPCAVLIANLPVEGLLILIPSCRENGGIEVAMSLLAEHVDRLKRICHSLD